MKMSGKPHAFTVKNQCFRKTMKKYKNTGVSGDCTDGLQDVVSHISSQDSCTGNNTGTPFRISVLMIVLMVYNM
jgi:hypothetical protein